MDTGSLRMKDGVAIVTGGGSGIGRALCGELGAAGARVVVVDIDGPAAAKVAEGLRANGKHAEAVAIDVRDGAAMRDLIERVARDEGRLDYIFNNAGIAVVGDALDTPQSDWDDLVDVNLRGVIHGVRPAYERMVQQGFGHIVNTGSIAGLIPAPGFTAYSATKHAVVGLSISLRVEAAAHGVRVSVVCPGFIDTAMKDTMQVRKLDRVAALESLPVALYAPEALARDVLRGVRRNDPIIVTPAHATTMALGYRFAPRLFGWIAGRTIKKSRDQARRETD